MRATVAPARPRVGAVGKWRRTNKFAENHFFAIRSRILSKRANGDWKIEVIAEGNGGGSGWEATISSCFVN